MAALVTARHLLSPTTQYLNARTYWLCCAPSRPATSQWSAGCGRDRRHKTGKAVPQHMGREVGQQITKVGGPQPHLPIADDRLLTGSTGEHQIADPGLLIDHRTGGVRQRAVR
jgi:hypothetical protein